MMKMSDESIENLGPWLLSLSSNRTTSDAPVEILERCGLSDKNGRLTAYGSVLAYHWRALNFQTDDVRIGEYLRACRLEKCVAGDRVLDVGCGIGQTLAVLGNREPNSVVGIDANIHALAFGARLAEIQQRNVLLVAASGNSIPFDDDSFSHVICHIALNYMHQDLALREMTRVLRPGGVLLLRLEGLGYDIELLTRQLVWRALHTRLYNLALGFAGQVLNWEPPPSSRWAPGRTFSTPKRVARTLRKYGCHVKRQETIRNVLTQPVAFTILAERREGA